MINYTHIYILDACIDQTKGMTIIVKRGNANETTKLLIKARIIKCT